MTIQQDLLNILACPKCKEDVTVDRSEQSIICDNCKLGFPVRDGIPVMIIDEAEQI